MGADAVKVENLYCLCTTEKAYGVAYLDDGVKEMPTEVEEWLPKSQVSEGDLEEGKIGYVVIPEWLAENKNLPYIWVGDAYED